MRDDESDHFTGFDLSARSGGLLEHTACRHRSAVRLDDREFEAELNVNPYDAVAHYQIAQILEVQQQPDAAAKELERTLELSPDFPEALVALARYRSRGDNHVGAITLLERVVKLQPASESSWYALMVAYRNSGRNDDAVAAKQKLDALQQSTAGEFSDFLRRIGETPQP